MAAMQVGAWPDVSEYAASLVSNAVAETLALMNAIEVCEGNELTVKTFAHAASALNRFTGVKIMKLAMSSNLSGFQRM